MMSGVATILFLLIVSGSDRIHPDCRCATRDRGVAVHFLGGHWVSWILLLAVTGAVVMAIGFNLGRIFGFLLSWLFGKGFGEITSSSAGAGKITTHLRVDSTNISNAHWLGFPP